LETLDFTKTEMESRPNRVNQQSTSAFPQIKVSAGHIQQVFLNIISNAIHAMPSGGKLTIAAEIKQDIMEISFTDTGMGIKKDNVGHVFDPFFTTKEIAKAPGWALPSVRYHSRHNGEIIVKSDGEDKGRHLALGYLFRRNRKKLRKNLTTCRNGT